MRKAIPADSLFKPKLSTSEKKGDATTRAAQAIIDQEVGDREAKTERLRAARLAREATEGPAPDKKAAEKRKIYRKG